MSRIIVTSNNSIFWKERQKQSLRFAEEVELETLYKLGYHGTVKIKTRGRNFLKGDPPGKKDSANWECPYCHCHSILSSENNQDENLHFDVPGKHLAQWERECRYFFSINAVACSNEQCKGLVLKAQLRSGEVRRKSLGHGDTFIELDEDSCKVEKSGFLCLREIIKLFLNIFL